MELITDLISSIQITLDSINKTVKKYQSQSKSKVNDSNFQKLCDDIMNSGRAERSRWEHIKIAEFQQHLEDRDLIKKVHSAPGRYAEISGKVWFGSAEYDFSFLRINGKEFTFYSIYDDHLTIEIHVTADHPTAKILLLK